MFIDGTKVISKDGKNYIQLHGSSDDIKCGFCDSTDVDEDGICTWTADGDGNLILGYNIPNKHMVLRLSGSASGCIGLPIKYCPWCGKELLTDEDDE